MRAERTTGRKAGPEARTAGMVLLAGAGLGVSADRLLWDGPLGPGLLVWITLLGASAFMLARDREWAWSGATAGWAGVAVLAAAGTAWRAAEVLQLLFLGTLVVAASMVLLAARGRRLGRTRVLDHVHGLLLVPWRASVGAAPLVGALDRGLAPDRRRVAAVGRGVLLALPPVAVFGALFAAADPAFERWTAHLTGGLEALPPHLFLVGVFGWIAAGLLGGVFPAPRANPLVRLRPRRVGIEETAIVLGLVSALFVVFVGLQSSYLFGGATAIEAASGLTLAEYARRGFFELVAVAGLVLALLLAVEAASPRGVGRFVFRSLAALLIGLVMLVIVSAALRLRLYVAQFGLTTARLYAAAVMAWLTATLGLYAVTVIRGRPRPFASGALIAGLLTISTLAAMNPDATVARTNLARAADHPVDAAYLLRLSADAVPTVIAGLDALEPGDRCRVAEALDDRYGRARPGELRDEPDWRTWNAGRAEARRVVRRLAVAPVEEPVGTRLSRCSS